MTIFGSSPRQAQAAAVKMGNFPKLNGANKQRDEQRNDQMLVIDQLIPTPSCARAKLPACNPQ
jgi:hypothetical protein